MVDTTRPLTLCVEDLKDIAKFMSVTVQEDIGKQLKAIKQELREEHIVMLKLNGLNLVHETENARMFTLLRHLTTEEALVRNLIRNARTQEYLNLEDTKVKHQLAYKYGTIVLGTIVLAGIVAWIKSL